MDATTVCNMALARLGGKRINDYGDSTDTKVEAIYCRLFYEQTAKALIRSHLWRFAQARASLSQNATSPAFEYTYAYDLPNNFLRHLILYDGSDMPLGNTYYSYSLEGKQLLCDIDTPLYLRYIKWVPSEADWDTLFVEVLVLQLARKLVIPLSQSVKLKTDIDNDLRILGPTVRALDRQESEHIGRDSLKTWRDARHSDRA